MTRSYPSDISQEQFDRIRPMLESVRKKTRPRAVDLYDIFCGILYVLKSVLVDGGYSGEPFANSIHEILACTVEIAKRIDLHTCNVIPKSWVVERSFS